MKHAVGALLTSLVVGLASGAVSPATQCQHPAIDTRPILKNGMAAADLPPFGNVCVVIRHPERPDAPGLQPVYDDSVSRVDLYRDGKAVYTLQEDSSNLVGWVDIKSIHFPRLGLERERGVVILYVQHTARDEADSALVFVRDGTGYRAPRDLTAAVQDAATLRDAVRKTNRYLQMRTRHAGSRR